MALADLTDPQAVIDAIAEFDEKGREAFLATYGFAPARDYFVEYDGKKYDSKAIAGVAHLHQHGSALSAEMFSGGDSTVANRLEKLGFDVTRPVSLPDWSTDELMLALDLYLRERDGGSFDPSSPLVVGLSEELKALRIFADEVRAVPRFRNTNGVSLKLHNFSSIDPAHPGKGMPNGSAGDREVWEEWAHRPKELAQAVALIRSSASADSPPPATGEEDEFDAPEGRMLYRLHRRYERDRQLVARKKKAVKRATGRLACEVCDFDSADVFGVEGVIDVHHVVPLHQIGESRTSLKDLALVCPTCHRTLHKHRPILTPKELREKLNP